MKRIFEELARGIVFAPQAVATATQKTSGFVAASETGEVEFLLATGPVASGKKLTVEVYAADDEAGAGAVKVADAVFTADKAMSEALVTVSCKPHAEHGAYLGVKFKHDTGADLVCAVVAASRVDFLPAENGWTLAV